MPAPCPAAEAAAEAEGQPRLAALRALGAQRFDPVHFGYLEALARRTASHGGAARRLLDHRLAQALAAYGARFDSARAAAGQALAGLSQRFPAAAQDLQRLWAGGDVKGLQRLAARLQTQAQPGPLGDLLRHIDQAAAAAAPASASGAAAPPGGTPLAELKALRQFRSTWARLSIDQQLDRSQRKVPDNPGPLNSQLLVQRSLRLMQDISPAYLKRFMSQMEALLWLDQASLGSPAPVPGKARRGDSDKKRKPGRGPVK